MKNQKEKKVIKNHLELLYMTPMEITGGSIYQILKQEGNTKVDYWEAMDILEIEFSQGTSLDIELIRSDFKDPSDLSFVKNRGIRSIFAITICEEDLEETKKIFQAIIDKLGGFLCADSENFNPFYLGNAKI